ncbi:unnamed protein product [Anisakis simplex]|uniref:C2H2-type domain-containing protein n=1 Tax=Anisakis simplex TaxID=6269 RepID=A0A0M3J5B8_ANISI|nr:unnamed protein product [Anisakis simplex]
MAGYHASFGSHHCILCGNRFKYDYNLLYHYRRSCPYTKIYIDREMREQLDATNLRKLVRKISQEELPSSSPLSLNRLLHNKDLLYNKRQMLRYQTNLNNPLPQLLIPKPGLQHAKSCPVCSVIFYGTDVVERHIKAAHPIEWELQFSENAINATNISRSANAVGSIHRGDDGENGGEYETDDVEPPPTLTAESPVEQPVVRSEPIIRRAHHIEVDEDGNQKLVDENGVVVSSLDNNSNV